MGDDIKKKISICISCYNEEDNVIPLYEAIKHEMHYFKQFDYEVIYADNGSTDKTLNNLRLLAGKDKKVKVIVNNHNFGAARSAANCVRRASGDAVIGMAADFQDPPELIHEFINAWNAGCLIALGQKVDSEEHGLIKKCRNLYYKIIDLFAEYPQYYNVTGFGIQDRKIVDMIAALDEKNIPTRNLLAELGYDIKFIPYKQPRRKCGKSSYNFYRYLNYSINSLVRTSRIPLRLATILGFTTSCVSLIAGIIYFIYKLLHWSSFAIGIAPLVIGVFFVGSVQLFFLGIVGEYIGVLLDQVIKRPLVVEKEIINFDYAIEKNGENNS